MILDFASRCATSDPQNWQVLGGKGVEVVETSQNYDISMLRIYISNGQNLQILGGKMIFFHDSKIFLIF